MPAPMGELGQPHTPSIRRRLAALIYEGVLLFGVMVPVGLVYGVATQQRHALQGHAGLQGTLFLVFGLYFAWFWSRSGQTLAMKTWHIRLQQQDGSLVSIPLALWRYILCWLWVLPALLAAALNGVHGGGKVSALLAANILAYAALARLHPQRQFLHDLVCGTRLVSVQPKPKTFTS